MLDAHYGSLGACRSHLSQDGRADDVDARWNIVNWAHVPGQATRTSPLTIA